MLIPACKDNRPMSGICDRTGFQLEPVYQAFYIE
jgi:hypothetical protein